MANQLSNTAIKGLTRIGDIIIPGDNDFPSFSAAGGNKYANTYVANAPDEDVASLSLVLAILSFMPRFVLHWLVNKMDNGATNNGPLGSVFRQLNLGIRGLIFSCYYNDNVGVPGQRPIDKIGFQVNRVVD